MTGRSQCASGDTRGDDKHQRRVAANRGRDAESLQRIALPMRKCYFILCTGGNYEKDENKIQGENKWAKSYRFYCTLVFSWA